jgi:hypothetical protein
MKGMEQSCPEICALANIELAFVPKNAIVQGEFGVGVFVYG